MIKIVLNVFFISFIGVLFSITYWGRCDMQPPWWLALTLPLLPFLYILTLLFGVVLSFISKNKIIIGATTMCLFILLFLWGQLFISNTTKRTAASIKIMTWNVQGKWNNKSDIKKIGATISENNPDVILIQEINNRRLISLLRKLDIPTNSAVWIDYYGENQRSDNGLAICVNPKKGLKIRIKNRPPLPPKWMSVFAELEDPKNNIRFNVLGLHIKSTEITEKKIDNFLEWLKFKKQFNLSSFLSKFESNVGMQGVQIKKVLSRLKKFKDPTIIAGDFNSTMEFATHNYFREFLNDTWLKAGFGFGATRWFKELLPLRIDYIYATSEFSIEESRIIKTNLSDHHALISRLNLKK